MPSLSEAPSGGAKTFWLLLGRLPKVTRCKSGTLSSRYRSNGYVLDQPTNPKNPSPNKRPRTSEAFYLGFNLFNFVASSLGTSQT